MEGRKIANRIFCELMLASVNSENMDATQLEAKQLKVKVTTLKSKSKCYTHYAMNLLHEQIRQKIQKLN